ncbi:MAG: hypothetical protein IT458_03870 [Planctomycetes bacterium]|nr:hypothetical protein [Planctomycetota bacterium]
MRWASILMLGLAALPACSSQDESVLDPVVARVARHDPAGWFGSEFGRLGHVSRHLAAAQPFQPATGADVAHVRDGLQTAAGIEVQQRPKAAATRAGQLLGDEFLRTQTLATSAAAAELRTAPETAARRLRHAGDQVIPVLGLDRRMLELPAQTSALGYDTGTKARPSFWQRLAWRLPL